MKRIFSSLIDKIKSTTMNTTSYVGISVSQKSVLEVVQFNNETKEVIKYGKTDLAYDLVARQINHMTLLESGIQKLYHDLEIPINTPAVLTLPTVSMNHQTLPLQLSTDEIRTALISETERYYIFKKNEPVVSWNQLAVNENGTQRVIYSAVQKDQIDQIVEIAHKTGLKLAAVESSYAALIRGLIITDIPKDAVDEDKSWCTLLITPNSFIVITLTGNKIVQITEEPLAVRSFNPEDIYPNIASLSMESTLNKNPEHIVIISKSDDVSAEILSKYLDLTCKVSFIEENHYNKTPLFKGNINISANNNNAISLESVGSTCWKAPDSPINFNLLGQDGPELGFKIPFLDKSLSLNSALIEYILLGLIALSFISFATTYLVCLAMNSSLEKAQKESYIKLGEVTKEAELIAKDQPTMQGNANELAYTIYDKNQRLVQSYNAISEVIPEKLWIEHFDLNDNLTTNIRGKAYSVEEIISYYQSLNKAAKFANLKIASIKVVNQDAAPSQENPEVTIIPSNNQSGDLPSIPNLPTLSSHKYYEFAFGGTNPQPTQPNDPTEPNQENAH
ncbi:MAG: hypothetical protein ACD_20C00057G0002 [uncultured bacterium]|nr:MAG: hypothetical protein ACD_20C00057G0002 [uncultured bacterium]HBH17662.1 hypothetical protein [Cyanobacteria bacterium UBA9579]